MFDFVQAAESTLTADDRLVVETLRRTYSDGALLACFRVADHLYAVFADHVGTTGFMLKDGSFWIEFTLDTEDARMALAD